VEATPSQSVDNGNTIVDQSTYNKTDGSTGSIDGVSLNYISSPDSTGTATASLEHLISATSAYNGQSQTSIIASNDDTSSSHPLILAANN
jgi:hypothetical protein